MGNYLRIIIMSVALMLASGRTMAAEADALFCEQNRIAAEQAAANAITTHHELDKVVNATIVGGSCGLLLLWMAVDGGLSTAICTILTAGAVVSTSTPANAGEIAGKAWAEVRDPRCLAK
jgi:predicted PurR-regulated permease PerM